jgi:hypothetical protein
MQYSFDSLPMQQFQLLAFRSRCGFPPWCPAGNRSADPAFKLDYGIRGSERDQN